MTLYLEKNKILKREISTEDSLNYKNKDLRIDKELKICKTAVATGTGELNIYDVFDDIRFNQEVDLLCGRLMRSVITSTFPTGNESIGAIQVTNKLEGNYFVRIDTFMLKLLRRCLSIWSHIEDMKTKKNYNEILNNDVFLPLLTHQFDKGLNLIEDASMADIVVSPSFLTFQRQPSEGSCPEDLLNFLTYGFISTCEEFRDSKRPVRNFLYMVRQCYWETSSNRFEYAFESFRLIVCVIKYYANLYNKNEVCLKSYYFFCLLNFLFACRKLRFLFQFCASI